MNMNMNMNMNMAAPGNSLGGIGTRVRFNTQDYRKYVALTEDVIPANPNVMRFPAYWDADLRAYEYLNEFLITYPDWRTRLNDFVNPPSSQPPAPFDLVSPHLMSATALTIQVQEMLDRAPDREDRFLEIIDQHDAEGSIGYFLGMLMIDPSRMPAANLLIRVARRIGEHIVMCLKGEFRCPRPSQLCTAIVPMIDPPATPAFPSGHSLQARLIARCLEAIEATAPPLQRPVHLLDDLAQRIGENRIIAGLHFRKDHVVGRGVAEWCFNSLLNTLPATSEFQKLLVAAKKDLENQWVDQPA
jgi:acid phosphatase (class A)